MSNTTTICEVSEVTFREVLRTPLYVMAYIQGGARAMYITMYISKNIGFLSAHMMYITTYTAMYMGLYVSMYMYAKSGELLSSGHRNSLRSFVLASLFHTLSRDSRNLANKSVTSQKCEVTNRVFGRNLATGLLKSLGILQFARLARLRLTILTYGEIYVHVMYMYILLYSGGKKITSQTSLTSQIVKNPMLLAFFYALQCEVTSQTPFSVTSLTSHSVTGG